MTVIGHPVVFNITTSENVTEVITVKIGENNYTTFVKDGKGTLSVYDLGAGNYTAYVEFAGNAQYCSANNFTDFNVSGKSPTSLNVSVDSVVLGNDVIIYVNVTGAKTGNVTLAMAGNPQTLPVVDGKVSFTVSGLSARSYHLTVMYIENNLYLPSSATADFVVYKKQSETEINVSNIKVGEYEIINVTVTPGATGNILIDIAGIQFMLT